VRELNSRRTLSRVRGRAALERRLRGLLVSVHRFGRARATTASERQWAAHTIDGLHALLDPGEPTPRDSEGHGRL
jgi:hypothetical protein